MIEHLRTAWQADLSFDAMVALRDELDATLQRIRSDGNITSPVVKCPECRHRGPGAAPHVSVRAMILSLARFGIAPAEVAHVAEKAWAAHRKVQGLDLYGKTAAPPPVPAQRCAHR